MSLVVMGTSYKTAPIALREAVAIPGAERLRVSTELLDSNGVKESLVLSTCNRVELYLDAKTDRLGADAAEAIFRQRAGAAFDAEGFYLHRGINAVHHLFKVVSSLDSQVLGEAQILGQVREAFDFAQSEGTSGEVLTQLFKTALRLGKRVRTETAIGEDSVSLSTVAYRQARASVADIQACRVMIIGAGEMAELTARYLANGGVRELLVCNRTFERAERLAAAFGGRAVAYDSRVSEAATCDVVFAITAADEPVITASELAQALRDQPVPGKQLVLIDESLPRNIELACADIPGVELFDLEALSSQIDEGLASRMAAVPAAEHLADAAEREFLSWMQERLVVPTIKAIYEKGEITVQDELERLEAALAKDRGESVSEREHELFEACAKAIMKKLLHGPTIRLRKEAQTADSYYYTGAARYLFGIETFPPGIHRSCQDKPCRKGEPCPMGLKGATRKACETQTDAPAAQEQAPVQERKQERMERMDIRAHIESHLREMGGMAVEDIQAMSGISLADIQEMGHMTVEEMHSMMGIRLMGRGDGAPMPRESMPAHPADAEREDGHE